MNRVLISDFNASRHYLTGPLQLRVSVLMSVAALSPTKKAYMTREPFKSDRIGDWFWNHEWRLYINRLPKRLGQ